MVLLSVVLTCLALGVFHARGSSSTKRHLGEIAFNLFSKTHPKLEMAEKIALEQLGRLLFSPTPGGHGPQYRLSALLERQAGNTMRFHDQPVMQASLVEQTPGAMEKELENALDSAVDWFIEKGGRRYVDAPLTSRALGAIADNSYRIGLMMKLVSRLERAAANLESLQPAFQLNASDADRKASGTWLLRYSNAPEITNLDRLPLGLGVEKIYQRVALARGVVENRALIRHRWRLLRQVTRVVASAEPAEMDALDRAGVVNKGNRLNVRFMKIVVSLRRVLFLPTPFLRIVARPNGPNEKEGRMPTLDLTYISDKYRISRGGDGSLFVLERRPDDEVSEPLEKLDDVVKSGRGFDGTTGKIEKLPT